MKGWLSLRLLLPVFISTIMLIVIGFSYYVSRTSVLHEVRDVNQKVVQTRLNFIQGVIEKLLKQGKVESVREIIASIAAEPDLISFIVVSPEGIMLASTSFSDVDHHWETRAIKPDIDVLQRVKKSKSIDIILSEDNRYLDGYSSLCGIESRALGNFDCGFIFYKVDMSYHYRNAMQSLRQQALLTTVGSVIGLFALLFLVNFLITRRVTKLIDVLREFAEGDRTIRSQLQSNDELGWLSRCINGMLQGIESDEEVIIEKEQRLESLFQTVADSIITFDSKGLIYQTNYATEDLFGFSKEEVLSENIKNLIPEFTFNTESNKVGDVRMTARGKQFIARKKNGKKFPVQISVAEMDQHDHILFIGVIRDFTEQKSLEEELLRSNEILEASANTDVLTGLANRRCYDLTLRNEINRATRTALPLSLLVCDLDHFKQYNDTLGHAAGDDCLRGVAVVMLELFMRAGQLPCRYGGEEFAIILPNLDSHGAEKVANLLLKRIGQLKIPHPKSSVGDFVSISIGSFTYIPESHVPPAPEELFKMADEGLYQAKSNGRNRVVKGGLIGKQELELQQEKSLLVD